MRKSEIVHYGTKTYLISVGDLYHNNKHGLFITDINCAYVSYYWLHSPYENQYESAGHIIDNIHRGILYASK